MVFLTSILEDLADSIKLFSCFPVNGTLAKCVEVEKEYSGGS